MGVTEVYINPVFSSELSTLVLTIPIVPLDPFNKAKMNTHRNTWRLSSTLYFRYYTDREECYWIRTSSMFDTKSKLTSSGVIRLMVENQAKIQYGLSHNKDVFVSRILIGGGNLSLGFDNAHNLKLFISTGGRYEKGSVVALSQQEYSIFLEKADRIVQKMKVSIYYYNN